MEKLRVTMFVSPMGHDVERTGERVAQWMDEGGVFDLTRVGVFRGSTRSISDFMKDGAAVAATDLFFFMCPDDCWGDPADRAVLERAVAGGTGVLFSHGLHPSFQNWEGAERMIGLLWRATASHGDYNYHDVRIDDLQHPITRGVSNFTTKDELFCDLSDMWGVDFKVLATAFSDYKRISRHGQHGTGRHEPVLTVGQYGKGRTVDFLLGHVWPHYTGHGLFENTMLSFEPPQFKTLLLRSCEWAATGRVERTIDA